MTVERAEEKICPNCNHTIRAAAVKCRFCKSDIPEKEAVQAPAKLDPPAEKLCQFCSETVKSTALKCKHCGSTLLTVQTTASSGDKLMPNLLVIAATALPVIFILIGAFTNNAIGWNALAIIVGLYSLPAIIAAARHKRNAMSIFCLNLFLGWTIIGWVVALVWAVAAE